jgi:hypothetical protein
MIPIDSVPPQTACAYCAHPACDHQTTGPANGPFVLGACITCAETLGLSGCSEFAEE